MASRIRSVARAWADDAFGPARWMQPAWRAIAAEVGLDHGAFLDLAAKTGWVCIHVASGKPELDAVGIERDTGRRERAEANRERRLNCTFKDLDAASLTYPDATFEAALALATSRGWEDADRVLREVHRVLAPNGRLLVYEWDPQGVVPDDWIARQGVWPPSAVVSAVVKRRALPDEAWEALKAAVKRSPFGGGAEGKHGCFRRLVLTKPTAG